MGQLVLPKTNVFRRHPIFWGLVLTPATLWCRWTYSLDHHLLFILSLLSIFPLAALVSYATEHLAEAIGDGLGGLLNATLGNMTELMIGLAALHAGLYELVKASIAGAVITNSLLTLGLSFLVGGIGHHVQQLNLDYVHMQSGLLLLGTIALLVPSTLQLYHSPGVLRAIQPISLSLSVILILTYFLGVLFSLKTHREMIEVQPSPILLGQKTLSVRHSLIILALATCAIGVISNIFVDTLPEATKEWGLSQAFIGYVLVSLLGGAAEVYSALHAAAANRVDLSVAIALGSSTQMSLFVAPSLVFLSYAMAPQPMNLQFPATAILMVLLSALSVTTILSSRRTTWYTGVLLLAIYAVFALTLFLMPTLT